MYSVKEFSNIVGLPFSTLRYYERIGLLNPQKNEKNNYRMYGKEECVKVNIFRYYRSLGIDTTYAVQLVYSGEQITDMKNILAIRENQINEQLDILKRQQSSMEQLEKNLEIKQKDEIFLDNQEDDLLFLPCTCEGKYLDLSFDIVSKWSGLLPLTKHMRRVPYEHLVDMSNIREATWEFGMGVSSKASHYLLEEDIASVVRIPAGKVLKFYLNDSAGSPLSKKRMVEALDYIKQEGHVIRGDIYLEGIPLNINNYTFGEIVSIPIE